jgi:hypothetical protein
MLNFTFDPNIFKSRDDSFEYIYGKNNSILQIKSFIKGKGWVGNKTFVNPIGQTDLHIYIHIIAFEKSFNIGINKANNSAYYRYRLPPWSINYAMVF